MNPVINMVAELTYINYAANRSTFPEHTPKSWEAIYGPDVAWLEERYQQEQQKEPA